MIQQLTGCEDREAGNLEILTPLFDQASGCVFVGAIAIGSDPLNWQSSQCQQQHPEIQAALACDGRKMLQNLVSHRRRADNPRSTRVDQHVTRSPTYGRGQHNVRVSDEDVWQL